MSKACFSFVSPILSQLLVEYDKKSNTKLLFIPGDSHKLRDKGACSNVKGAIGKKY